MEAVLPTMQGDANWLEALRKSEVRYRELFEQSPIPTIEANWSGLKRELEKLKAGGIMDLAAYFSARPLELSRLREKIVRYSITDSMIRLYHATSHHDFERYVSQEVESLERNEVYGRAIIAFNDGLEVYETEGAEVAADGAEIITLSKFYIPPGSRDDWHRVLITIEDVTERRANEARLRQSQKLEVIGQLTGGVAHDFNNLLTVILGNAELLEMEFETTKEASENIDAIKKSVARGASLTERLLAFARKTALRPRSTDVGNLIKGLGEMLQRTLGAPVDLRINVAPDLWLAMIDPHQLENALVNLAVNSRDAMPQGGVLTIDANAISVTDADARNLEELSPGDYVKVTVSDTGGGISSADLKKVIDPFFTTKEVGEGSGLGLSMVYGFARQSKGYFKIESEIGFGTSASLYLPKATRTLCEYSTDAPNADGQQNHKRILVVEDDPEVLKICTSTLRKQGFDVVAAIDGKEAMNQLSDGKTFDLLFTDIILPGGMNGAEIAENAKTMHRDIKVVYTTGYADLSSIRNLTIDPNVLRINKPYPQRELLEKINAAFAN